MNRLRDPKVLIGLGVLVVALAGIAYWLYGRPVRKSRSPAAAAGSKAAVDYLKLRDMPYLYVLNAKGTLSGFGPVGEFTNLLALAMR